MNSHQLYLLDEIRFESERYGMCNAFAVETNREWALAATKDARKSARRNFKKWMKKRRECRRNIREFQQRLEATFN